MPKNLKIEELISGQIFIVSDEILWDRGRIGDFYVTLTTKWHKMDNDITFVSVLFQGRKPEVTNYTGTPFTKEISAANGAKKRHLRELKKYFGIVKSVEHEKKVMVIAEYFASELCFKKIEAEVNPNGTIRKNSEILSRVYHYAVPNDVLVADIRKYNALKEEVQKLGVKILNQMKSNVK